jgi:ligand-binding sensor domain-containing protein
MKVYPYILAFTVLMGLCFTAQNQETRKLELNQEGVFRVSSVYVDDEGVKWFGTSRGLYRFDDLKWSYYTEEDFLLGNQVNALAFEQTLTGPGLWVATTRGVSLLEIDGSGVTASTGFTSEDGLLNDDVADIVLDSRKGKFFGSADGVTFFHDGIMDSLVYSTHYASMLGTAVRQMDIFGDTLYIAQDGGIGRFISGVDGITGASRWTSEYGMTPYSENIRSVTVNGIDKQWFGTDVGVETHRGYFAKDNWDLLSGDMGLVNEDVISISEEADGGLWFGTYGGVSHYEQGVWTSYTTSDGLLNDTVYDIGFDPDGSIWFATGAGVSRLLDGTFQDFITAVSDRSVPGKQMQVYYRAVNRSIHLEYQLELSVPVSARLYNISGLLVGEWSHLPSLVGDHRVELPSPPQIQGGHQAGIYVIQLIYGNRSDAQKLIIAH